MKKTIITTLFLTITHLFYGQNQNAIEEIATYLTMTGNYEYANECYEHLLASESAIPTATLYNNIGINLVYEVMSMFSLKEGKEEVIFIFPFEIAPTGTRDPEERRPKMEAKLELAIEYFQKAFDISRKLPAAKLNHASALTLLGRMRGNDQTLYVQAIKALKKAGKFARQQNLPDTEGNTLILEGIIYHYLGNSEMGNKKFQQAADFSHSRVQRITENNIRILRGESPLKGQGEKRDVFEDKDETVAGWSMKQLIREISIDPDTTLMTYKAGNSLSTSNLYVKKYQDSDLYLYQKGNSFAMFLQTSQEYDAPSGKGLKVGDRSEHVYEAYGTPLHIQPAQGGRFLYYKSAGILFFIDSQDRVGYWTIFGQKKG